MRVTVFGATGSVGRHLVAELLDAGHQVRAVARHPDGIEADHPSLERFAADVMDGPAVRAAVRGADAVLVTLGSKKLTGNVRSAGTANIVAAMQAEGVSRLVCQSTLGTGDSRGNLNFYWKYLMFGLVLRAVYRDHERQEEIVRSSGLDWTIVRPSAFTDGPVTRACRHGFGPDAKGLNLTVSRRDVAAFMGRVMRDLPYSGQAVALSN